MMSHHVLVASDSAYRRAGYVEELASSGLEVTTVAGGVECVLAMRDRRPDVVLLELSLLWGGSRGVLAIRAEERALQSIPVVLIAVDGFAAEWYQSAEYSIQGFLLRRPPAELLVSALLAAVHGNGDPLQESGLTVDGRAHSTVR